MSTFKVHDADTAPADSKPLLENSVKSFGSIPNLHGVLATSPQALEAYQMTHKLFMETSFNQEELTVVWQTINVANECHYCVPAHTAIGHMMKIDNNLLEALRNNEPLPNAKLQALKDMTLTIRDNRGVVSDDQMQAFKDAGYGEQQVLEIILGLAQKTISNYTNHFAKTPVDEAFQKFAWEPQGHATV